MGVFVMGKMKTVALALVFMASLSFIFSGFLISFMFDVDEVERYVFLYINEERVSRGLPALGNDTQLCFVAKGWADSMVESGVLEHGDFEGRLRTIDYFGVYRCGEIIENYTASALAVVDVEMFYNPNSAVARELVQGWLDSPPHREIMLTDMEGDMGVAVSLKGLGAFFGVVDFKFV